MFKMYAFGMEGVSTICNRLNHAGYRKRSGKLWDRRVILLILRNPIYAGKLRWRQVVHEAHHEPLVSQALFDKVNEVLKQRSEDLNGRRWHNNDERLLTGVMRCARCHAHMFGAGAKKKGKYFPYYVCSKRTNTKECDQDYVRADYLEAAVIQDVKTLFRDDALVTRIWEEANRKLDAERPDVEKEIASTESQLSTLRTRLDGYFTAFESGTLKPDVVGERTEELNTQIRELDAELRKLRERREQLELPTLDRAAVAALIDDFEQVMAAGTNPQKKHLLHQVVKKVLVYDRLTVEVWYGLPYPSRLADSHTWLPKWDGMRTILSLRPPSRASSTGLHAARERGWRVLPSRLSVQRAVGFCLDAFPSTAARGPAAPGEGPGRGGQGDGLEQGGADVSRPPLG